jgi:hypothetical protein
MKNPQLSWTLSMILGQTSENMNVLTLAVTGTRVDTMFSSRPDRASQA